MGPPQNVSPPMLLWGPSVLVPPIAASPQVPPCPPSWGHGSTPKHPLSIPPKCRPALGVPWGCCHFPPKKGNRGGQTHGGTLVHRVTPQPLGCLSPSPPVLAQGGLSWGSLCVSPPPQQRLVDSNPQHLPPPLRTQHTFPWDLPMVGILGGVLSVSPGPLPDWGG